jgi:hypothetical protein
MDPLTQKVVGKSTRSAVKRVVKPPVVPKGRVFKTGWFDKIARKRGISDQALCEAAAEVMLGLADDLGGGVWKKRLNKNMDRSIVLAKGAKNWIFVYLFQKNDRENIDDAEEAAFKRLADAFSRANAEQIEHQLLSQKLVEICNDKTG